MSERLSGSGLQSQSLSHFDGGGSDLLSSLSDRVSSALDRAGGGASASGSPNSAIDPNDLKKAIAAIGGNVPNFSSIV